MQKETTKLAEAAEAILRLLIDSGDYTDKNMYVLKRKVAFELKTSCPSKILIRKKYVELLDKQEIDQNEALERLLKKSTIRTSSGVAPIAIVTKPYPCPGNCIYCPTEVKVPKSYNSNEPAIMRAIMNKYDPADQIKTRIRMLEMAGHSAEKVEVIVLGGTFSALPDSYIEEYFSAIYKTLNGRKKSEKSIEELEKENETAKYRCTGVTVETRPDFVNEKEIIRFRRLGITRVEMGVQHLDDEVQKLTKRGHTTADVKKATYLLKEAGFKVVYHIMPNLPGSTPERDIEMIHELFIDPDLCPDQLKIYNCVVTRDSELKKWYEEGKYEPYDHETLLNVLIQSKLFIPVYCRVIRLGRDIPATNIIAGSKYSNIRQKVHEELKKQGKRCMCIRCREVRTKPTSKDMIELKQMEYPASFGKEFFISYESTDGLNLYAHVRLRFPDALLHGKQSIIPELQDATLIREVHTYGQAVPIDVHQKGAAQHIGLGKQLIAEAEKISRDAGYRKIAIISGVGVREYYRKLGYELEGTYMIKQLADGR